MHDAAPIKEYDPAGQFKQVGVPAAGEKVPAGHLREQSASSPVPSVPTAQGPVH